MFLQGTPDTDSVSDRWGAFDIDDVSDPWGTYDTDDVSNPRELLRATLNKKEVSTLKERFDNTKQTLQLTVQIQRAPVMEKAVGVFSRSSLETELAAKENEISQLADDIQSLQSTVNYLKEASASQIIQLEETLIEKNKTIQELEEKLIQQKDYEEIKKELSHMFFLGRIFS
ncbi:protein CASP-like [Limulus polyphemus]|uniref:Protein CASP-like n=1 Tax=Limulus polyphemus TaxID=6850 RepID=A0ABM1RWP2_LIMPO|nr:protein CASP-like [Limulus polyphemus]